ncbi:hypothetical protein [Nocardioides panacisoli]|uniref:Uncharacterized protein n=1 Tax=Nocardioides panacisoli TaxID=627624 RepID=A0ABP7IK63_9ACTN
MESVRNSLKNGKAAKAVLFGLPLIVVLACSSGSGGSDEESTGKQKDSSKSAPGDVGNWDILNKPTFGTEYGTWKIVDLKVKNVSKEDDEPWLEIRLTNKKNDLVATFDCVGNTVNPGQTTTLQCSSMDKVAPYTDYEIKNAV